MSEPGACQTSNKGEYKDEDEEAPVPVLDEGDIALLKTYGLGPYTTKIKQTEKEIKEHQEKVRTYSCSILAR